jgi:predicted transcriptional regulator
LHDKLKNRSKLDIIHDILASANGGIKKTHIMSRANLSSEQMNFYFNTLLFHSLLDQEKDGENNLVYRTTQKGLKFLHCCAQIKSLIAPSTRVNLRGSEHLLFQ